MNILIIIVILCILSSVITIEIVKWREHHDCSTPEVDQLKDKLSTFNKSIVQNKSILDKLIFNNNLFDKYKTFGNNALKNLN